MNFEDIEAVASVLREFRLAEIEVGSPNGETLRLRRGETVAPLASRKLPTAAIVAPSAAEQRTSPAPAVADTSLPAAPPEPTPVLVTAGLVGIFRAHGDGDRTGAKVRAGQIIGQIEAMRLLSDCLAPTNGTIQAMRVRDGQPVEYGQPLFEIATATEEAAK